MGWAGLGRGAGNVKPGTAHVAGRPRPARPLAGGVLRTRGPALESAPTVGRRDSRPGPSEMKVGDF